MDEGMVRREKVFDFLRSNNIEYTYYEHPEAPTAEIAQSYCAGDGARHCKNLFLRNYKGDRHYLVVFDYAHKLAIHDLEHLLHQGRLSFASEKRMERYLALRPGSVSPFGLINDTENHVHLFLDENLRNTELLAFHPNDNRASVLITTAEFAKCLATVGNSYEYIKLY